nr:MAG TPA: hypothetical protein [Caudoviricetes sp.]
MQFTSRSKILSSILFKIIHKTLIKIIKCIIIKQ